MNKKTGLSILGAIAGVFLCLISSTLYFWLRKLLQGTSFSSYYTKIYTVFIPFLVGNIVFMKQHTEHGAIFTTVIGDIDSYVKELSF